MLIIKAKFAAVLTDNGSVYEVSAEGREAYGVLCDNAGRADWTLMDTLEYALAYAALSKGMNTDMEHLTCTL